MTMLYDSRPCSWADRDGTRCVQPGVIDPEARNRYGPPHMHVEGSHTPDMRCHTYTPGRGQKEEPMSGTIHTARARVIAVSTAAMSSGGTITRVGIEWPKDAGPPPEVGTPVVVGARYSDVVAEMIEDAIRAEREK